MKKKIFFSMTLVDSFYGFMGRFAAASLLLGVDLLPLFAVIRASFVAVFLALFAVVATPGLFAVEKAAKLVKYHGLTMGSSYTVKLFLPQKDLSLGKNIQAELQRLNQIFSTYQKESEISRLNRATAQEWQTVSPEFALVLRRAASFGRASGGAFDVTIGPLVRLWGFESRDFQQKIPSKKTLADLGRSLGWSQILISPAINKVQKKNSIVKIDLSAIAKGYAVDQLANLVKQSGAQSYMVEVGGEVRASGRKPDGSLWKIAIEQPVAGKRLIEKVVGLQNRALATSGNYRNFFELGDTRYSHIIDPRTGYPVSEGLLSVSVIANDCLTADGWATALMVLGVEKGLEVARQHKLAVYLIWRQGSRLQRQASQAFQKYIQLSRANAEKE